MATVSFVVTSIAAMVLQNCLFNDTCKRKLKTAAHINLFNITVYAVCILLFGGLLLRETVSVFTVLLGLLFGIVTGLGNFYKMRSLASGPMHITLLVTTSSMIIPSLSGIFFGETFSLAKLGIVVILIGFIYLSIGKSGDAKIGKKWVLYCALAFAFQGTVGVIQKIHQSSAHKAETSGFLLVAFVVAMIFAFFRSKGFIRQVALEKKTVFIGLICGGCTFAMNYINLQLTGLLPSQLLFPLVNGSAIILNSVMSVIVFKETLSKRQMIGLVGGIISLIGICLVP